MISPVCFDAAGAFVGGAKRFLSVLDNWIADTQTDIEVIGRDRHLTPAWIAQREFIARRSAQVIALNNVSFAHPLHRARRKHRTVLLRNALHFSNLREFADLNFVPSRELRLQTPIVRRSLHFADRIIVPSNAMAERVRAKVPAVDQRLEVIGHPVNPRPWNGTSPTTGDILVPVVNSPYKQMHKHLAVLAAAIQCTNFGGQVRVTSYGQEYEPHLGENPKFRFLGMQSHEDLDRHWRECSAIYFPPTLEAFGFPLAEARVNGRFVLAPDTDQSAEIAGAALLPFRVGDVNALAQSLRFVEQMPSPVPDPQPFDPRAYFENLIRPDMEGTR